MTAIALTTLVIIGLALNGIRLRARVAGLAVLQKSKKSPNDSVHQLIVSDGVVPNESTPQDATAFALNEGLDVVDLIPARLPVTAARDLMRQLDPAKYGADRLGVGRSAGAALLASPDALKRSELTAPDGPAPADLIAFARRLKPYAWYTPFPDRPATAEERAVIAGEQDAADGEHAVTGANRAGARGEHAITDGERTEVDEKHDHTGGERTTADEKRDGASGGGERNAAGEEYAGVDEENDRVSDGREVAGEERAEPGKALTRSGAGIAVAPGLRAGPDDLSKRRSRLHTCSVIVPIHLGLEVIPLVLVAGALVADWRWGLAALAAYCLQPYLIFAGTAVHPRGLHAAALLRPVHDPYVWVRTIGGRWRSAAEVAGDATRVEAGAYYECELADGIDRFFEPRREDCPWCGSGDLSVRLRTPDLVYAKPGTFTLEQCAGCGHVFQNPRLNPAGLDFYYRDFYDGVGAANAESIFLSAIDAYRARARMLESVATPKTWLDVGAGHAHFCATASEIWPDTVFDGLDWGDEIDEAARRGWIGRAHRGMFPAMTDELCGTYDVVSMHHYLEHTRDPFAELDAAAKILPPGGHLLIEVPDPEWQLARMFGKYWMPWFQPQHQHMIPIENLKRALTARGLTPVVEQRATVHQGNDFIAAAYLFFAKLAPALDLPWSTKRPTAARRLWRGTIWMAGYPTLLAALLLDRTVGTAVARRASRGNAYRVLAQKASASDR